MASFVVLQRALAKRLLPAINRRLVHTSKKSNETAVAENINVKEAIKKEEENWISYGFSTTSKTEDRTALHSIFFASVTLCFVFGSYFWAYFPDFQLRDWAQREAFLELKRREAAGLPLIDPNVVPVGQVELPSDEDLEGVEIII